MQEEEVKESTIDNSSNYEMHLRLEVQYRTENFKLHCQFEHFINGSLKENERQTRHQMIFFYICIFS